MRNILTQADSLLALLLVSNNHSFPDRGKSFDFDNLSNKLILYRVCACQHTYGMLQFKKYQCILQQETKEKPFEQMDSRVFCNKISSEILEMRFVY